MSEVTDLITSLQQGSLSLDEVAQRFRARSWPDPPRLKPRTAAEADARLMDDPDPYLPGSFDDVLLAFDKGELTQWQFEVLAHAAADAMEIDSRDI